VIGAWTAVVMPLAHVDPCSCVVAAAAGIAVMAFLVLCAIMADHEMHPGTEEVKEDAEKALAEDPNKVVAEVTAKVGNAAKMAEAKAELAKKRALAKHASPAEAQQAYVHTLQKGEQKVQAAKKAAIHAKKAVQIKLAAALQKHVSKKHKKVPMSPEQKKLATKWGAASHEVAELQKQLAALRVQTKQAAHAAKGTARRKVEAAHGAEVSKLCGEPQLLKKLQKEQPKSISSALGNAYQRAVKACDKAKKEMESKVAETLKKIVQPSVLQLHQLENQLVSAKHRLTNVEKAIAAENKVDAAQKKMQAQEVHFKAQAVHKEFKMKAVSTAHAKASISKLQANLKDDLTKLNAKKARAMATTAAKLKKLKKKHAFLTAGSKASFPKYPSQPSRGSCCNEASRGSQGS
jgi:hypothetical protein